jgi:E3 SUMO-protein ligase PIAS1
VAITANLKGMRGKPGTAPSAELPFSSLQLDPAGGNQRVEMVYSKDLFSVESKVRHYKAEFRSLLLRNIQKYYMTVFLVEVTTAEQLVDQLKREKRLSKGAVSRKSNSITFRQTDN